MQLTAVRTRVKRLQLLESPHYGPLFGARLERIFERPQRTGLEIVFDVVELRPLAKPRLCLVDGSPAERLRVHAVPRRVRFPRAEWRRRSEPYAHVQELASDDPRRVLFGLRHLRLPTVGDIHIFGVEEGELVVRARRCALEDRPGDIAEMKLIRRWALTPLQEPRLVPAPRRLHTTYGGDPIAIRLGARRYRHRLFIGGLRHQSSAGTRPDVDAVLNLCNVPNAWLCSGDLNPGDRWEEKGEGRSGMTPADLLAEAEWVVDRLRAGKQVLVHCYAGINRSATVCCAALILLEGLSAEEALARVRERHPEAWPDPYHWLLLRWLARRYTSPSRARGR
jgi:hypothetical protein